MKKCYTFLPMIFSILFFMLTAFHTQAENNPTPLDDSECITKIQPWRTPGGEVALQAFPRGKGPFSFKWSTGDTTQKIIVKEPGKYCVEVKDADGCVSDACFELKGDTGGGDSCKTIIVPRPSRDKSKGVKLTAKTRGKAPFTYEWSTGETTQTILAKKPGKYCVKVKDADGCVSDACFVVKDRDQGGDKCKTAIRMHRSARGIKLEAVTRGKAPFKYKWSTGEDTKIIAAKKPGKYCVKVEDANGCVSDACIEVKRDNGNDKCKTSIRMRRSADGKKIVAITRGKAPFKYKWSTGEDTKVIVAKKPGKYCVKVEDANGCVSDACIAVRGDGGGKDRCKTIIQPSRIDARGKVKLTARTKGKSPFKYRWSTGEDTETIIVKKPGKYCVKVEDANGCVSDACFVVRDRNPGNDRCKTEIQPRRTDKKGVVKLTARTKGEAPFKYRWSTGEDTETIIVEKPGKYCVKVEDANGCISGACFELKGDGGGNDRCKTEIQPRRTDKKGVVKLIARTKGEAPFKYRWSTGENTETIVVEKPGKYCVKVEDANGCISGACFEFKGEGGGNDRCETQIVPRRTDRRGVIKLTARTRGKAPFKYRWSTGEDTETIIVKKPGKYCVKVEDANRCVSKACFDYRRRRGVVTGGDEQLTDDLISFRSIREEAINLTALNVYPNPVGDVLNLSVQSSGNQIVRYSMINMNGQVMIVHNLTLTEGENIVTLPMNELPSGQYILNLTTDNTVQNIRIEKN